MSFVIEDIQFFGLVLLFLLQCISYGFLDVVGNLLYCFGLMYILYFYIDVVGISFVVVGVILLLVCIIDGIDVFIWGIIIDKICLCYGKCCFWFLWLLLFFVVFSVLLFWFFDISMIGKVIYVVIFYMIVSILFIGFNILFSVILFLMILFFKERLVLNFW